MQNKENVLYIINQKMNELEDNPYIPWWSIAKTVIATAIFKLVEQDKLSLTEKYFGLEGTLEQVLRHEAGIPDYEFLKSYNDAVTNKEKAWPPEEMLVRSNVEKLRYKPGESWAYSNIGYYYLRLLIEKATNLSLEEAINQLVFYDIGINDVIVAKDEDDLLKCTNGVKSEYDPNWVYHGMLIGSLKSACIFIDKLASGEIINKSSFNKMKEPYELNFEMGNRPWSKPSYSYGMMVDNQEGILHSYGHTGGGPGSVVAVYHFPNGRDKVTIASYSSVEDESIVENDVVRKYNDIKKTKNK